MSELDEFKGKFRHLLELRQGRDIDKTAYEKSEKAFKEAEAELYEELEEAGIRGTLEFDFGPELGVAKFKRSATRYGRVLDRDTAIAALKAMGYEHVINEETVRKGRLNELVRRVLETKGELPDGIDFYVNKGISISRKSGA